MLESTHARQAAGHVSQVARGIQEEAVLEPLINLFLSPDLQGLPVSEDVTRDLVPCTRTRMRENRSTRLTRMKIRDKQSVGRLAVGQEPVSLATGGESFFS